MAELPPRKNSTPTKLAKLLLSPLQVLLQMGFPQQRVEKALAATGYRNVQLASDWLLAHVNDTTLDNPQPREYVLYLCPDGLLHRKLQEFWVESARECGRNGAHEFLPHVTLIPPFQVPDSCVPEVVNILDSVTKQGIPSIPDTKLESYISPNFMGFFLDEISASAIRDIAIQFTKELLLRNISAEAHTQALHLTLAYNFPSSHFSHLESLVKTIDPNEDTCEWQLRLYSRDIRLSGKKVYKVIYPHVPRETDELELLLGDFVYIDPEIWSSSVDGWIEGISWLTGCFGYLPKNYVEKTAESDAWTLHRAIELYRSRDENCVDGELRIQAGEKVPKLLMHQRPPEQEAPQRKISPSQVAAAHSSPVEQIPKNMSYDIRLGDHSDVLIPVDRVLVPKSGPRRIFIVRHGERVDFTFGTWIPYCFDASGNYVRKDLNMPLSVPKRQGSPESFFKDCPLTMLGEIQANLLGQALRSSGSSLIRHVYCSPSLRSLQTCHNILKGLQLEQTLPIALEPGLFEWLAWYQDSIPQFMTPEEMVEAGFYLKKDHQYLISFDELYDRRESAEQYYVRSHYLVQRALRSTEQIGGDILLVGHASTLDACSRQLVGGSPRNAQDLRRIVHRIPYCSLATVQQCDEDRSPVDVMSLDDSLTTKSQWKLIEPPVPPMTYSANLRFDWQTLFS